MTRSYVRFDKDNIIGERYGRLVVTGFVSDVYKNGSIYDHNVKCHCDCGKDCVIPYFSMRNGNHSSCGCLHAEKSRELMLSRKQTDFSDEIGKVYGRLKVLEFVGYEKEKCGNKPDGTSRFTERPIMKCECQCNKHTIINVKLKALKCGHTQSCGCIMHEILLARNTTDDLNSVMTSEYGKELYVNVYNSMIKRCYYPKTKNYNNYGGRGIKICKDWYTPGVKGNPGFINFYKWAISYGYKYEPDENGINKWSIDRIDVNGNYSPDNCRWTTRYGQADYKRNIMRFTDIDGEECTPAQFIRKHGLSAGYIIAKLNSKWTLDEAVYAGTHQDLKIRHSDKPDKFGQHLTDSDGFSHLTPTLETQRKLYELEHKK